jgi:ATP-binding cassette subfamily B protein
MAVARRLQMLSIAFHGTTETGRLQTKMLRDVEQVQLTAMEVGMNGLSAFVQLVFVLAYTGCRQPAMLLFFLVLAPAALAVIRSFRGVLQDRNSHYRRNLESMNSRVVDMVEMLPLARAHAVEETAVHEMHERVTAVNEHGRMLDRTNALFSACTWVTFQVFGIAVLAASAWLAWRGSMPPGDILVYTAFFAQLIMAMNTMLALYPQLARGLESVGSLREVLQSPDIEHNEGKETVPSVAGEIVFERVSFTYPGSAAPAVRDLDIRIPAGATVAFVGASGSGKSTLVNLAIGFLRPESGRILLDGMDMERLDMRSWRQRLSLVPQQTALFNGTIRQNILFGLDAVPEERFEQVARLTHVREFVERLENGYDTVIGEGGARLSGGQKQRLAIARALIRDPRVIVLDEPTSALDLESERYVQQALDALTRGRTTIIVAHRLSTIRHAHLVCVVADGRIVESGAYDELVAQGGAFARLRMAGSDFIPFPGASSAA